MRQIKILGGIVFSVLFFGVLLFVPAGTFHWWRAWVFLGVVLLCTSMSMAVLGTNEELLNERYKSPFQKGQPFADKILLTLFVPSFAVPIALIPADVFHLQLLPAPGPIIAVIGLLMFIAGWALISVALYENTYAAPVIKHQEERHQHTIDTGAYAVVRHPMYSSVFLLLPGMALWLESYAAAIIAILPALLIAMRAVLEERFLSRELADYPAYMRKVRYRLIPYVW